MVNVGKYILYMDAMGLARKGGVVLLNLYCQFTTTVQ